MRTGVGSLGRCAVVPAPAAGLRRVGLCGRQGDANAERGTPPQCVGMATFSSTQPRHRAPSPAAEAVAFLEKVGRPRTSTPQGWMLTLRARLPSPSPRVVGSCPSQRVAAAASGMRAPATTKENVAGGAEVDEIWPRGMRPSSEAH